MESAADIQSAKLILVILDGFGHREDAADNAIAAAHTPNWDGFLARCPHTLLSGSGVDVGLPAGQMGNSEVGHMVIGAGRVVHQDLARINQAMERGEFESNAHLNALIDGLRKTGGALHVLGLLSPGGVHSHERQIFQLIRTAHDKGATPIHLHAFLDGRDTPPASAAASLEQADALFHKLGAGGVASICGRYFAMDRDQRWPRTERAFKLIVHGEAPFRAASGQAGLQLAYERGETDEFVQPTAVGAAGEPAPALAGNDAVLFMNFRADRARQLSRALLQAEFDQFPRHQFTPVENAATLTRYAEDLEVPCLFEPAMLANTFGEHLSRLGKRQLRAAETEKYAHVTFFFSGGREQPFPGEERLLVPSPEVATYDLKPEMSAAELTAGLTEALRSDRFDAIVCNYANGDMVGHTGQFDAAVAAVETLDQCLGQLAAVAAERGWRMLITADHGNVERMRDAATAQPHTAHTTEAVPLVYVGDGEPALASGGTLADVAPTALTLMGIAPPSEMTGRSLIRG